MASKRAGFETRAARARMVERHIAARGVKNPRVLAAMRAVPREYFMDEAHREWAYDDTALPIAAGQTISQPYIVALMTAALEPRAEMRVLEVGTGSGYAAAVLSRCVARVYTIERHRELAEVARERFAQLGYDNIEVRVGDGTRGWPQEAPFDAIVVTAGGPRVPRALREQLTIGGVMVIPVGADLRTQSLLRVRRTGRDTYQEEDLGAVRFVPLIGDEGWGCESAAECGDDASGARRDEREDDDGRSENGQGARSPRAVTGRALPGAIAQACEPFAGIDEVDLSALLERVGDARVVLLGESTHGTSEFYRMRAAITRALVERKGFTIVAVEADWPDALRIDRYVRHLASEATERDWEAFSRFPRWMWRNDEVVELIGWMHQHNGGLAEPAVGVGFFGLDLYSLYTSIGEVLTYLTERDPETAALARERYGCLTRWEGEPSLYGRVALTERYRSCEEEVAQMLRDLLERRSRLLLDPGSPGDVRAWFDAEQNARLIANAERYYRAMYLGSVHSWNLRDLHMFETLQAILEHGGEGSRAVIWAHNSHLGDARATEMGARGEHNLGQLCRQAYGDAAYLVGFGTHTGTVAAARGWDEPMRIVRVCPSHERSYERLCHEARIARFMLPLREGQGRAEVRTALMTPRLERAIGVIYRPETELASHYFQAVLPAQFDEWIWFDESRAVSALRQTRTVLEAEKETWPFGL